MANSTMTVNEIAKLQELCQEANRAAVAAGATDAEAFAASRKTREVVYEKNDLKLARTDEELAIGIRVVVGRAMAFVTTNNPSAALATARQAVSIARLSPEDQHCGLPEVATAPPARDDLFDPELARLGSDNLTVLACDLVSKVQNLDARVAIDQVRVSLEETAHAISSTRGALAGAYASYLSGFVMGMAKQHDEVGSFTYDGAAGNDWQNVNRELDAAASRFVTKAVGALGSGKGRSFKGKVLLTPEAVGEILVYPLLGAIGADCVRKGRSPLQNRVGEAIASPLFNLRDPGSRLGHFRTRQFDREGLPVQAWDLVDRGKLTTLLFDSYEARIAGCASTGHAQGGATSPPRLGWEMAEVLPGDRPSAAIEAGLDLALVVPRFSGRVEMATGDFSGVVKGGFLLENGGRTPVTETMIAGNLYQALKAITAVSSDRLQIFGASCFPAILVDNITVTAG